MDGMNAIKLHPPQRVGPGGRGRAGPGAPQWAERIPRPGGWLRFETGWLSGGQIVKNLETVVSTLQTAAAALDEISDLLGDTMAVLDGAWGRYDHGEPPPAELDDLVVRRIAQIGDIAGRCRFHGRGLLDGQSGVVGSGKGVVFVRGGPNTVSSPPGGYEVRIRQFPTRAALIGGVSVHEDWLRSESEIFLAEGERFVRYAPESDRSVADFLVNLQEALVAAGLDLEIGLTRQRRLVVRHNQYGAHFKFKGSSRRTPLLSKRPGKLEWSRRGRDIEGTVAGEPAFGIGCTLVGFLDNERTSELSVTWRGDSLEEGGIGRVCVVQNGLLFQEDGEDPVASQVRLSLPPFLPGYLGRWLDTRSGFRSLAECRAHTWRGVQDTVHQLFAVICDVDEWRERVTTWIERYQARALAALSVGPPGGDGPLVTAPDTPEAEDMATLLRRLIHEAGA